MLSFTGSLNVFIALEPVDMGEGINTLQALVSERIKGEARRGALVVFTNKRRRLIKILFWDGTGMWLMVKRLEQGTFVWPRLLSGARVPCCALSTGPGHRLPPDHHSWLNCTFGMPGLNYEPSRWDTVTMG